MVKFQCINPVAETLVLFFKFSVASGSFIYDVDLKMSDWVPTKEEMMVLSAAMHRLDQTQQLFLFHLILNHFL